jgi:hypothetical protein
MRLRLKACRSSGCICASSLGPLRHLSLYEYRARVSTRGGSYRSSYHTDTLAYGWSVPTRSDNRVVPSCVATRVGRVFACSPAVWVRVATSLPAFCSNRISHLQPSCGVACAIASPPFSMCCQYVHIILLANYSYGPPGPLFVFFWSRRIQFASLGVAGYFYVPFSFLFFPRSALECGRPHPSCLA